MVVLSNFLPPQQGIRHEEQNTTVYINQREVGKGTLYITESVLSWVNNTTQEGFSLEYLYISLHAVSKDEQAHTRQCLYVIVDAKVDLPGVDVDVQQNEENSSDDNADPEPVITEIRFAPDNINNLEAMFTAVSYCQTLHPDPQDSFSDAEEEVYVDAEEDEFESDVGGDNAPYILSQEPIVGNQNGNDTEDMEVEPGVFEDAEEGY